jgi:DNA-binding FrmR family transcriptional regulator
MPKKGKSSLKDRLHRIEGQIRGVERMMEEGEDSDKIITQIEAVISGLKKVKLEFVKEQIAQQMERKVFDTLDKLK